MHRSWLLTGLRNRYILLALVVSFTGCLGDLKGPGTEGSSESGSIMNVESITGTYLGTDTNKVDVVQNRCPDGTQEPFEDHTATIQITNNSWPNATEQTASTVYLDAYTITYTPNDSGLPTLDSITTPLGDQPCQPNSTCQYSAIFVDKATKEEYLVRGGDPSTEGHYLISYIFYGQNIFGERVSFEGGTDFTVKDYDNCAGATTTTSTTTTTTTPTTTTTTTTSATTSTTTTT